ncbi:MAG TPA: hypothetical protein PK110_04805 [Niabella sp.]|nr:hypothetical protein [Niabella sp.]
MKTIYDFSPTEKEIKEITGYSLSEKTGYMDLLSDANRYMHISILLYRRGEKERALEYDELANKSDHFNDFTD